MARDRLAEPTVYGRRAKLGVIVPPTNTANEAEWNRALPVGVSLHAARMKLHEDTTSEAGQRALYEDVRAAVLDLAAAGCDAIAYGCTAGSMVSPVSALPEFMQRVAGRPCVTTAEALVKALHRLGARRVAVATPYHDALNRHEAHFLAAHGIETVSIAGLGYGAGGAHEYRNIARVAPEEVLAHAEAVDRPEAEAILLSCTDLATFGILAALEARRGKPAISSNSATLWLALRAAGISDRLDGLGRLLAEA
jgi:maleate cis-trans isomerase